MPFLFGILLVLSLFRPALCRTLFVSPLGSDSGSGTLAKPFRTLEKALVYGRSVTPPGKEDLVIQLRRGRYELARPLSIGPALGGAGGYYLILKAYRGEKAVLSGGRSFTSPEWKPYARGIYSLRLDPPFPEFRNLYADDRKAVRARSGKLARNDDAVRKGCLCGESDTVLSNPFSFRLDRDTSRHPIQDQYLAYAPSDSSPPFNRAFFGPRNFPGVEFVYYSPEHWRMFRWMPLHADTGAKRIPFCAYGREGFHIIPFRQWALPGRGDDYPKGVTWVENSLDLLDRPGEWFYDKAGILYYYPEAGADPGTTEFTVPLPGMERLIRISGTAAARARNVRIEGLTFEHASFLPDPQWGFATLQVKPVLRTVGHCDNLPAAVETENAADIGIRGNTFANLGGDAINIGTRCEGVAIEGNTIRDISGNGIVVGGTDDGAAADEADFAAKAPGLLRTLAAAKVGIRGNAITRIGNEYFSSVGIFTGNAVDCVIRNNSIEDVPYSGIFMGWGWHHQWLNLSLRNEIAFNRISYTNRKLRDGAGIYVTGRNGGDFKEGTRVHDNLVTHWFGMAGIYLDNGVGSVSVTDNVVFDGHCGAWLYLQDATDNDLTNAVGNAISGNRSLPADNPYPLPKGAGSARPIRKNEWGEHHLVADLNGLNADGSYRNAIAREYSGKAGVPKSDSALPALRPAQPPAENRLPQHP